MTGPAIAAILDVLLSMAIDTPGHPHCCDSRDPIHGLDRSVAFLTGEARFYVALVGKVNEIGNVVNLDPRNGLPVFPEGRQLDDFGPLTDIRQRLVTSHALADAGNAGGRRAGRIYMAVLARNPVVRCMHLVTEFDWLDRRPIGKIFAVYEYAYQQSNRRHNAHKEILLRGPERIENRD